MNREDIIRMAREACVQAPREDWNSTAWVFGEETLERFASLVAAAERNTWPAEMEAMERQVNILTDALAQAKAEEREACAKVCADMYMEGDMDTGLAAAAIRARSNT